MKNPIIRSAAFAGACLLAMAASAPAQVEAPDNAKALLEKVKRRDLDRQIAARQTGLDRLAEDLVKGRKEAETMQANISATSALLKESAATLSQHTGQRKRLEQVGELTALRIEAERLKGEGLQLLGDAQTKALAALTKRAEETEIRAALGTAELAQLTHADSPTAAEPAGKDASGKARPALAELRKKLAHSDAAAVNAEKIAFEAMRAASSKLDLADIAGAKARKKAASVESDLPAIAEKPLDLEEKPEKAAPPK